MNDVATVKIAQGVDDLGHVALNFDFGKAFASLDELVEGLKLSFLATWLEQSSRRMYTFSWSSKTCSNCTMLTFWRLLWILISDMSF